MTITIMIITILIITMMTFTVKINITMSQNNNYNNLQWMSSKENTRKSQSKKILQKTLNGELIKIWGGFGHIQEELGLHKSNIQKCCAGIKYKTAYGYKWEYDNYNCNL
jgi:hypothetical protein